MTVRTVVPPGLARGDEVRVDDLHATVVSDPIGGADDEGERGRVALAVERSAARALLDREGAELVVLPRGDRPVEEFAAALRRNGCGMKRVRISSADHWGEIAGALESGALALLAVRRPEGSLHREAGRVEVGEEVFLAGTREALGSVRGGSA